MKPIPTRFLDKTTPPHLATLILISGLSALSMNIFLPSLPNMAADFDADYRVLQLSVSVYLAFSAVLQLAIGPLSDRYGRRNVLLGSLGVFLLASLGTVLAPTAETFLVFRMLQASIATGMALSRAIVRDMVDDAQAASMIGYLTLGMSVVPMIGPALGGYLDELFGWRASFSLLILLGLIVILLVWSDLGETNKTRPSSFREQIRDYPELLTSPRFWGFVLTTAFSSGVFFAYLGGAPFVGTEIYNLSPSTLGLLFSTAGLGYGIGNYFSGRYSTRLGTIRMINLGNATMCLGFAFQVLALFTGWGGAPGFFMPFLIIGVGNGLVLPNSTAGSLSVRPHLAGTASGLGGAIMIGGGAALSALSGALLTPESGAWPLVAIMGASLLGSVISTRLVVRRNRTLGVDT